MAASKLSEQLAASNPLAIAAVLAMRWAGRTAIGRRLGVAWYRRSARRVADDLLRVPGVETVFVTGSTARGRPALGYSDIDLMLATDLRTVAEELEFRRRVEGIARRHNRPVEKLRHLDYVEARDLEFLRCLGNASSMDLDEKWTLLAGRAPPRTAHEPTLRHREIAGVAQCLRFWLRQSGGVLSPRNRLDGAQRTRTSRRLFQTLVLGCMGLDERAAPTSFAALLEELRGHEPGEAVAVVCRDPSRFARERDPSVVPVLLAASLEALDAQATRISKDFRGRWPPSRASAQLHWPSAERFGDAALRCGFGRAEVLTRASGPEGNVALVTTPPEFSAKEAVSTFERFLGEIDPLPRETFGRMRYPALLTPTLRAAAALIEPYPTAGARLAAGASWVRGSDLPPPLAPSAADLDILVTISLVKMFWQSRGRALRFGKLRRGGVERMAVEVVETIPELLALRAGRPVDYTKRTGGPEHLTERQILERLRESLDQLRPELAERLETPDSAPHDDSSPARRARGISGSNAS